MATATRRTLRRRLASLFALILTLLLAAPPSEGAAGKSVTSVAVMPMTVKGKVNKDTALVLDQMILSQLHAAIGKTVRVVGKADIDALLGFEKTKDAVGCTESTCAAEVAGALGVDSIITGTIGNIGKKSVLSISWIGQRDARPIARHTQDLGSNEETFDVGVRSAIAAITSTAPASPSPPQSGDVSGMWRWDCCGGQYSGWIILRQSGTQVKGLLTDLTAGSSGILEGFVNGSTLRFIRRIPAQKLVQDYTMTLAPDGLSAKGDFDNAGIMNMTRDTARASGADREGVTGTYKWECCDGDWFGSLMLIQDKSAVYGVLYDERGGSGGYLEGTMQGDQLKLRRGITRESWQSLELRRVGRNLEGAKLYPDGKMIGKLKLESMRD